MLSRAGWERWVINRSSEGIALMRGWADTSLVIVRCSQHGAEK